MSELVNQNIETQSPERMQREIRALKRKLALMELNLSRAQLVSDTQERTETILNASYKKELQFFKLVLENSTSILLLLDFDGRFAYASRTFLTNAGIPNFGLISGRHFHDVLKPIISEESLREFTKAVDASVEQKHTVTFEGKIDFNQQGTPRIYTIFVTPMTDEDDGKSTGIMALFSDITEINDAMESANRANLAKSDFLANMSHEIRTPLNAIAGMSAIAQSSADIEKIHYCLDKINDSTKHLLGVINDILDMSKIEASHFELSFSEFVFEKMLLRIVDVMRFKLEEKHIAFHLHSDPAIPYAVYSDEQRLSQVIMNLLSNAVKFTPEGGRIALSAEVESASGDDCMLRISIQDTGIGISEEQKPRLFKAFSQADSSISRKYGGTGLGLAISKSIINLLGGDIGFESIDGAGTTFTFTIMARSCRQDAPVKTDYSHLRILVVDTMPDVLSGFCMYANKLGIACTVAKNADAALDILWNQPHDILFVDQQIAVANGFRFIGRIRELHDEIMIAMMIPTADCPEIESEAKAAGIRELVSKPILLPVIENVLDKYFATMDGEEDEVLDDFSDKTILLADDVDINREIVISLLEYTGITVICAENGRQAVDKFIASPGLFDLIFMDIQMPEMDGYEATRRIRASGMGSARQIPIVAMTANVFKEDVERCLDSGMNDHIGKPVNLDEILAKIKQWTSARATTEQLSMAGS